MKFVTCKRVYPYECTDRCEKLDEMSPSSKDLFYNTLTETHISSEEYDKHARYKCQKLNHYSVLYLKVDVILFMEIFENFCGISTYSFDSVYYYTAPGFSFDCMLKFTNIKSELLSDYEMLLIFEKGKFLISLTKIIYYYY